MPVTIPPLVTLTGTVADASGQPVSGTITAVPVITRGTQVIPVTVTDASGFIVVAACGVRRSFGHSSGGTFSLPLAATDTAGLAPANWAYQFTLDAGIPDTFTAFLPGSPSTLDFSALVPATPGTALSAYVPLTGGTLSGTLTLGGSPALRIPSGAAAGDYLGSDSSGNAAWQAVSWTRLLQASADTTGAADKAAISAAISAASASGGGLVQLGAGTFWVNASVAVPAGVTIAGLGRSLTTIKVASGSSAFNVFTAASVSNAAWHDLTIDLNSAGNTNSGSAATQMGISVTAASASVTGISIRRVTVQNGWQQGISVASAVIGTYTVTAFLEDAAVTNLGASGIVIAGGLNCRIVRPVCTACGTGSSRSGILVQGSAGTHITGPICTGNTAHGVVFNFASFNTPCSDFQVTGGDCSGNGTSGYGVCVSEGCHDFTITGVRCEGNGAGGIGVDVLWGSSQVTGTASSGTTTSLTDSTRSWTSSQWAGWTIRFTGGTGNGESAVITSNTATAFSFGALGNALDATTAYALDGSHIFTDVGGTISGCVCANNTGTGIWVDYASSLTVTGCELHHNGTYGINMVARNCVVAGNDIHDNTSTAVHMGQGSDACGGHLIGPNLYANNGSLFVNPCTIPSVFDQPSYGPDQPYLLGVNQFAPGTRAIYTSSSTTLAAVDQVNMTVSFTAPASGQVLVRLTANGTAPTTAVLHCWGLLDHASGNLYGSVFLVNAVTSFGLWSASQVLTGLTAGQKYQMDWALASGTAASTVTLYAMGSASKTIPASQASPAVMEVWAA
jgi:parallel beta-helix repeat protein